MANKARWRTLPLEMIQEAVSTSISYREVAQKLGYATDSGGTQASLQKMVAELQLDTSHFLGKAWNKENYNYESFTTHSVKKNGEDTLNPLIKLRGRKCEKCGLETWLGNPITLEIHHKDGDRSNNTLENLLLLCPNCHSYTSNWRGRGKKKKKSVIGAPRQETS